MTFGDGGNAKRIVGNNPCEPDCGDVIYIHVPLKRDLRTEY
jgi:hypothetical protein